MNVTKYIAKEVSIPIGKISLKGKLNLPPDAKGLIIFVHGSGSSRLSPRNKAVAQKFNEDGFGTFLFDLLTEDEDQYYPNRFDIHLLTERLMSVTGWLMGQNETREMPLGYFGASTGAAAALTAAAKLGYPIKAVVCRGGRTDLALNSLDQILAAVLFLVGEKDEDVLKLNEATFTKICSQKELRIIQGASHLFEEPGALEEVAKQAEEWFGKQLKKDDV